MRLAPKHWSTETWWCSMHGHVAPGVATAQPPGGQMMIDLDDGTRLSRCLRCDAWVHSSRPEATEPGPTPRPLRGKALDELVVIRAIAIERGLHVIFFLTLAAALVLLEIGLPALQRDAQTLLPLLDQTRGGQQFFSRWLDRLINLDGGHVWILAAMSLGYALLEAVEAFFLWRGKRWAEYLTVVATAAFLPVEIYELVDRVSALKISAMAVNLAILAYLIWTKRLFGVRGGIAALERELAEDVDWDDLDQRAPLTEPA